MTAFVDGFVWVLANLGLPVAAMLLLTMVAVEATEHLQLWLLHQKTQRFIAAIQASDRHDPQVSSETAGEVPPANVVAVEGTPAPGSLVGAERSRRDEAPARLPQAPVDAAGSRSPCLPASSSVGAVAGSRSPAPTGPQPGA